MNFVSLVLLAGVTFWVMEWVAWATHKHLMHGALWVLHRDHHQGAAGFFQRNDAFFVVFAIPSWLGIMLGLIYRQPWAVAMGAGVALYGLAYFAVHEVFIHRRFRWWRDTGRVYWLAVRKAHHQHHKHLGRQGAECFGMLWVEPRFLAQARKNLARNAR